MNVDTLTSLMAGLAVPQVRYFDTTGSTNDEALAWISDGAHDGSLVVADRQTAGRGRLGRRWVTEPGAALAFSLILRPQPYELAHVGLFSPLGAVAISIALEETLGLDAKIKWPNDVLLAGPSSARPPLLSDWRKAAGILVEASWFGETLQGLVIGIGINVAPNAVPPADQLLFPAISVEEAAGHPVDRAALLRAVVQAILKWRSRLSSPAFHQAWEERLAFRDEWVRIEEADGMPLTGQVVGIDSTGSLLLRSKAGMVITIQVGDVHLRLHE